ncbi:carbohydrate ABC transporter permease [Neobacillus drentensis]|uniref:carbohydrate ABC transporter permease n=1 Tax=Neobacillus drentensis TaxID=220684 RepID=UPI00285DDD8D|nr:carbohydrate ABC transporter permease [Neobacillus drentensis]MDR7238808.1 lactose/L-arabinose transport system permease protein [Neobacillus drentensis]
MKGPSFLKKSAGYLFLIIASIASVYPFYWMFVGSTLSDSDIFQSPPKLLPSGEFMNNITGLADSAPIWSALGNSLLISTIFTIATLYLCAIAGYAFAKYEFKGKNIMFVIVLVTMMLPHQVTLIPLFKMIIGFGWQDQPQAVILPALANAFGVFFMRQNMMSIPTEMIEAARIDGASEMSIFHKIILPTSLPPLAALGILSFIQQWGNYLWPLIILQNRESTTLPVLLSQLVAPGQVVYYGQVLAGTVISIVPVLILFLLLQKYFISGIYGGSVKG